MNRSNSPKLSLSIDEFCELYNDVPKVFVAYATMVNLSADTYRETIDQVIFEDEINSNYWIISFNTTHDAWLVPTPSRKVNYAELKSLPFAFNSNNQDHLKQISLSEPAQVMTLPTEPTTWKLIKRGSIEMIQSAKQTAMQTVNAQLVELYWQVGAYISHKLEQSEWGDAVVQQLADYLLSQDCAVSLVETSFGCSNFMKFIGVMQK